jgi:hypothetical protein
MKTILTFVAAEVTTLLPLALPEPLAATNLAATVAASAHLTAPEAFEFTLTGPPGIYTIFGSADLVAWNELGRTINILGSAVFADSTASLSTRKFYRARQ